MLSNIFFAMISRYFSLWTFIFLFVQVKTRQYQDVRIYNISSTWINATSKCGTNRLEYDTTILSELSVLRHKQFWIGIGIYQKITPWMDVLGCYQLQRQRNIFLESSAGLCLWKCNTKYFSYKKILQECMCLNDVDEDTFFGKHLSLDKCTNKNKSEAILVHEVFNGNYKRSGKDDQMCMTFTCNGGNTTQLHETHCMNTSGTIEGLCEDGKASSNARNWGLPYSTQQENCENREMLLLHSNTCRQGHLWNRLWTNIFREQIEVEIPGGNGSGILVRCLSANISVTEITDLQISQENCTSRLNWFVCKTNTSPSTTRQSEIDLKTLKKDASTTFEIGPVIGGITGAIALLAFLLVMIFCKIRSCGFFKTSNTDKQERKFSTAVYEHSGNPEMRTSITATSNESYGITSIKTINTYAVVNKIKTTDSKLRNSDETYTEASYGEYDRFDGVSKRRIDPKENLYDSHVGIRNEIDPTYDSSNHGVRKPLDNDVYDHTDTLSTDDYSTTVRSKISSEHDVYDKAF